MNPNPKEIKMGAYDAQQRFDRAVEVNRNGIVDRLARIGVSAHRVVATERGWSNFSEKFDRAAATGGVLAILYDDCDQIDLYRVEPLSGAR